MKLLTKRFVLRDFVREDAPQFEAYHADPRTVQFYDDGDAAPGHARDLIELFIAWASEHPRCNYQLAIFRRDDARTLIGCCGLRRAGSELGKAEFGIELAPAYWGRHGYALEVTEALVDFGFGELGLQEIHGATVSANSRIARLAESVGAVAVKRSAPDWMVARGWSAVEWQVTRAQWEDGRQTMRSARRARARRRT